MLKPRRFAPLAVLLGLVLIAAGCTQNPGPSTPANQAPYAIFTPSVSTGNAPLTVDFDASDSTDPDGTIVAYNWDFGDFQTGSGVQVSHEFTSAGSFTVKLTVTDNKGKDSSSSTVITVTGPPPAPTGLTKTGAGCCDTYGDFSWDAVPGATQYQIQMIHTKSPIGLTGCLSDHSGTFPGNATSGRVQAFGLCLGTYYNVSIRAQANGLWGDWSPVLYIKL